MRAVNQRSVVEAIQHHGALTRSQVARTVGLSKPTVSEVFNELLESGLLQEAGSTHGTQGPRAALYEVNHEAAWVVGVDVGRRWVRAAVADLSGRIVARHDERAKLRSEQTLLEQIGTMARAVTEEHNHPRCTAVWRMTGPPRDLRFARLQWRLFRTGPFASNGGEAGGFVRTRPGLAAPDLQFMVCPPSVLDRGAPPSVAVLITAVEVASRGRVWRRDNDPESNH